MNVTSGQALIVGLVLATGSGCGGATVASPSRPPSSLGAETRQSRAEARVARLRREVRDLEAARRLRVNGASSLPAGSDEIEPSAAASTVPATGESRRSGFSETAAASFARLAHQLPGREGVAITAGAHTAVVGDLRFGTAWSTSKVPVAMAAISAGTANDRDLVRAITASDNTAAERLWASLGASDAAARLATQQLRLAGDQRTVVEGSRILGGSYTAFGQTNWRLADQARFVLAMRCSAAGRRVATLMGETIPSQRWGLGSVGFPATMKGGWGPGLTPGSRTGWMDRQFGTLTLNGRTIGIALASSAPDHASGTRALSRLATWAAAHSRSLGTGRVCE